MAYLPQGIVVASGMDDLAHEPMFVWRRHRVNKGGGDTLGSVIRYSVFDSLPLHTWLIVYSSCLDTVRNYDMNQETFDIPDKQQLRIQTLAFLTYCTNMLERTQWQHVLEKQRLDKSPLITGRQCERFLCPPMGHGTTTIIINVLCRYSRVRHSRWDTK